MGISVTESAAKHVEAQLVSRGKGRGIRVGVKTSGCSGLSYVLEFVDEVNDEDQLFESYGVKLFVDPKSLIYLEGTQLDLVKNGLNEGLEFRKLYKHQFIKKIFTLANSLIYIVDQDLVLVMTYQCCLSF